MNILDDDLADDDIFDDDFREPEAHWYPDDPDNLDNWDVSRLTYDSQRYEYIQRVIENHDMERLKAAFESSLVHHWEPLNESWYTPYRLCAYEEWPEGMKYMASIGADIDTVDHEGMTVLMRAQVHSLEVLKTAIELGSDILCKNTEGVTALKEVMLYKNRDKSEEKYKVYEFIKNCTKDAKAMRSVPIPDVKVAVDYCRE